MKKNKDFSSPYYKEKNNPCGWAAGYNLPPSSKVAARKAARIAALKKKAAEGR